VIEKEFVVPQKLGMHARPCGMLVNEVNKYRSAVTVNKDGLEVNGKSVMGLMLLAAECGARLKIKAEGPDEQQAITAIGNLFARKFDEA
jgi:phosphocarrier protein